MHFWVSPWRAGNPRYCPFSPALMSELNEIRSASTPCNDSVPRGFRPMAPQRFPGSEWPITLGHGKSNHANLYLEKLALQRKNRPGFLVWLVRSRRSSQNFGRGVSMEIQSHSVSNMGRRRFSNLIRGDPTGSAWWILGNNPLLPFQNW